MVIAREIEANVTNWSSGVLGSGCIGRGNNYSESICGYSSFTFRSNGFRCVKR